MAPIRPQLLVPHANHSATETSICVHVCMYACIHTYIHVCMYICMNVCVRSCVRVCVHACMHACMYVCVYMCACMYVNKVTNKSKINNTLFYNTLIVFLLPLSSFRHIFHLKSMANQPVQTIIFVYRQQGLF